MKKFLLLAGISVLTIQSCKDDDIQYWDLEILSGTWKYDKTETVSGKDGKTIIVTNPAVDCEVKNTVTYTTDDKKARVQQFQGTAPSNCTVLIDETVEFNYDADTRTITYHVGGVQIETYNVIVLSKDMLELRPLTPVADANDDNIPDIEYIYFKR